MLKKYGGWPGFERGIIIFEHILAEAKAAKGIYRKAAIFLRRISTGDTVNLLGIKSLHYDFLFRVRDWQHYMQSNLVCLGDGDNDDIDWEKDEIFYRK